jgi:hypothetical protein
LFCLGGWVAAQGFRFHSYSLRVEHRKNWWFNSKKGQVGIWATSSIFHRALNKAREEKPGRQAQCLIGSTCVCVCNILTVFFFFSIHLWHLRKKTMLFLFYFIRIHYFNLIIDQQAEFEYQIKLYIFSYRFLV